MKKTSVKLMASILAGAAFAVYGLKTLPVVGVAEAEEERGYTATLLAAEDVIAVDGIMDGAYNTAQQIRIETVTANVDNNETPATAEMRLMWDHSYLYLFADVSDTTPNGYLNDQTWLEFRDCFEVVLDLFHDTENPKFDVCYGVDYRGGLDANPWNICEGHYKMCGGSERIEMPAWTYDFAFWLGDSSKGKSNISSQWVRDEENEIIGYTMEMKLSLGDTYGQGGAWADKIAVGKKIGLGVKIYDNFTGSNSSVTCMEEKNDAMLAKPSNLSEVTLVAPAEKPSFQVSETRKNKMLDGYLPLIVDGEKDSLYKDCSVINVTATESDSKASAQINTLAQADGLYVYADIKDTTADNLDALSLCLDFDMENRTGTQTYAGLNGAGIVNFGATGDATGLHDYYTKNSAKIRSAVKKTESGYTCEAFLPYPEGYRYNVGGKIGFSAVLVDYAEAQKVGEVFISKYNKDCLTFVNGLSKLVITANKNNFEYARKTYTATRVANGKKIDIDGMKDEAYQDAVAIDINSPLNGASKSTAQAYVLWTNNYLYVFVDVSDPSVDTDCDDTHRELSDSVELYVDTWNKAQVREQLWGDTYRPSDYKGEGLFRINAGDKAIRSGLHYLYDSRLGEAVSKVTSTGYTAEFRIDYDGFKKANPKAEDKLEKEIAIAIIVNDSDSGSSERNGVTGTNYEQFDAYDRVGALDLIKLRANTKETAGKIVDFDDPKGGSDVPAPDSGDDTSLTEEENSDAGSGGCGSVVDGNGLLLALLIVAGSTASFLRNGRKSEFKAKGE